MLQMMMEDTPLGAEHGNLYCSTNPPYQRMSPPFATQVFSGAQDNSSDLARQQFSPEPYYQQEQVFNKMPARGFQSSQTRYQPYASQTSVVFSKQSPTSVYDQHNPYQQPISSQQQFRNSVEPVWINAGTTMHDSMYSRNCNSNNNSNNSSMLYPAQSSGQFSQDVTNLTSYYDSNIVHHQTFGSTINSSGNINRGYSPYTYNNQALVNTQSRIMDKKVSPEVKKRATKKRKKKGANEPQRPVSAYALFFRDTQAAIKAENSSATFGEISKIVASMWDSLSEEAKQVYKQKTETAKRDYLKHLAAFRANMISKGNLDAEEEDLQPLSVLRDKMAEQRATTSSPSSSNNSSSSVIDLTESTEENLPPPPRLHLAPGISHPDIQLGEPELKLHPVSMNNTVMLNTTTGGQQQVAQSMRPPSPVILTKIIVPGQNGAQSTIHLINSVSNTSTNTVMQQPTMAPPVLNQPTAKHIVMHPQTSPVVKPQNITAATPSPPPPIQLRNIVSQQPDSPITFLPNKPGQIIRVVPSQSGGVTFAQSNLNPDAVKGRIIKMVDVVRPVRTPSPSIQTQQDIQQSQMLSKSQDHTPILQLLAQETSESRMQVHERDISQNEENEIDENALMQIPQQNLLQTESHIASMDINKTTTEQDQGLSRAGIDDAPPRRCVREGCNNLAVSCPYWDNEYCSNECVYSHCRDVFDAWVSTRQVTTSVV
ncbi:TOX high mobility group box family member 4-A-like isoform X1 [Styela clava]